MQETVKSLRQKGYKVKCFHTRNIPDLLSEGNTNYNYELFDAKGGKTEVQLIDPNGIKASGEAKCSNKENYCRKTGVKIALGRALKALEKERNPFEG